MKLFVQGDVGGKGFVVEGRLAQHSVDVAQCLARFGQQHRRGATFCGQAGRQAFQRAAQFYRLGHIALGKGLDGVTAIGQGVQQAFLLQPHQGGADRRARETEFFDNRQLGDACAAGQLTTHDHCTQAQLGFELHTLLGAGGRSQCAARRLLF